MRKLLFIACLLFIGVSPLMAENWKHTLDSLEQELSVETTDTGKLTILLDLSDILITNEPGKAMEFASQAKVVADRLGDKGGIVESMLKQCDFYTTIGEYNTSLKQAYEALEIAKPDKDLLAMCHNRIATIHAVVDNFEEALYHNKRSLYFSSLREDSSQIMVDIHNIGRTFTDLKMYDSALYYLRIANRYEMVHNNRPDPYSLSNIGNVFLELEEYDSALFYHLQAYKYDVLDDQKYLIGIDQQFIAITYFRMKHYAEAREYALNSIEIAREMNAYDLAIDNYEILYQIYRNEGNYEKSLEYALQYTAAKDTLYEKGKQSLILGLETKHRVKEQEERLRLLEKQKSLYFILTIVSVLFFFSMIIIVFLVYRRQRMYQELTHELQLANDSKERLLSVISHDLRGSVGTLRSAARAILDSFSDTEDVRTLLESFYPVADSTYDLLENLLTWAKCNKENITPDKTRIDLREVMQKSIEHTQHLASAKSVSIINNLSPHTIKADKNMILSVMRNLLSNAIKFSHPKSKVLISEEKHNDSIVIGVADNGIGMEPEVLEKLFRSPENIQTPGTMGERGSGLGIMICKTFLQAQGGKIWAESTPGKGTTFYFSLPDKA